MDKYYLITFDNTSMTIMAEAKLKETGVNVTIMPTPTYVTKSCGISIRINDEQGEMVKGLLERSYINFKNYYCNDRGNFERVI